MSQIELPEGWCEATLQDVADWGSGGTPSRKYAEYYDGDIPWVKTGDLGPKLLESCSESITELGVKNSSAKLFPKGSVALAMYGATIGRTSILGMDATTNQACAVGNPVKGLTSSEFLYYFLSNEKDRFIAKGKGGAQPNISQAVIKEHPFFLPPLAEQKVIVDKLDTLLAQVESIKARLERIPETLKQFHQSVLAAAVTGKLMECNEEVVFKKLAEVGVQIKTGPFGSALHKSDYIEDGVPVINPMHINNGVISPSKSMTISKEKFIELDVWKLRDEDIVLGRRGEMGRAAIVKTNGEDLLCGTGSMIVRVDKNNSPKYIEFVLRSPVAVNYFNSSSVGTTMVNLNQKIIKELEVFLPSLQTQLSIVELVENYMEKSSQIEQQAQSALNRVNNLTQSILAKAFRGELTAGWREANPELISGKNSAEALLERIKAEHELAKPVTKRGRGKA